MAEANSEDAAILEIRRFYALGYSDTEIMRHMSLSEERYRQYVDQIIARNRETLKRIVDGKLAHEIIILKERLELTVANCSGIALTDFIRPGDRLEAERIKMQAAVDIVRLLRDGLEALGKWE